jgi:hypothetical protein
VEVNLSDASHHLTDYELNQFADGGTQGLEGHAAHVRACQVCRERIDAIAAQQRRLDSLRFADSPAPGPGCPDPIIWWRIARGTADTAEANVLLAHAARCGNCGPRLRNTIEDLSAEVDPNDPKIASLPSSTPAGMREQANRLSRAARSRVPRPILRQPTVWLAAAALIILGIAVPVFFGGSRPRQSNLLLAHAYESRRTLEFRFPAAAYSPLRQDKGASSVTSNSFLEASAIISRELARRPGDARWIQSDARAKLIEWRYDDAIAELTRLQSILPGDASVLADLATAYFERAQAADDPADYRISLDLLTKAISLTPANAELHFNRAIVLRHLSMPVEAVREWEAFLGMEGSGGWAKEARSRLAELQQRLP